MNEQFSLIGNGAAQKLAVSDIISCNQTTSRFGLILNESDAAELAKTRSEALKKNGMRIKSGWMTKGFEGWKKKSENADTFPIK